MDAVDLKILSLIQNDARVAHASVGGKVGLTAPAVYARIKRLEREGIIQGYLTAINPAADFREITTTCRSLFATSGAVRCADLAIETRVGVYHSI